MTFAPPVLLEGEIKGVWPLSTWLCGKLDAAWVSLYLLLSVTFKCLNEPYD